MVDSEGGSGSRTPATDKKDSVFSRVKAKLKPTPKKTEARLHLTSSTPEPKLPFDSQKADPSRLEIAVAHSTPPCDNQSITGLLKSQVSSLSIHENATAVNIPDLNTSVAPAPDPTAATSILPVPNIQTTLQPDLSSMKELWNVAYDELKQEEEHLITDYEQILRGDLTTMLGATVVFSGSEVERKDLMRGLLIRKAQEVKDNTWKLKFSGQEIPFKDLAKPILGVIRWADDYISGALQANPYASVAWAGVSLLLPLTLNPSEQAASLAKGLEYISDLIVRSTMREALYERRYGYKGMDKEQEIALSSHKGYQDTLKCLYVQILKFQAKSVCYLSKNGAFRLGLDVVKWNDWGSSLSDIQKRENAFCQVYEIWKDIREQEICEEVFQQHREKVEAMGTISCNVVALQKAVEDIQRNSERRELLSWLSSSDPSENYNTALHARQAGTGEWLLRGNDDFEAWKTGPNSVLWLNGKAGSGKSVLSASIIENLRETYDSNPEMALVFFYFSFTDSKKQNVIEMLSSIIKQLCCRRPDTPPYVASLSQYQKMGQRPDEKTLLNILLAATRGFSHVHLVLDALDECPVGSGSRETLLETINRIVEKGSDNLHLLVTSRRETDIETALKPLISFSTAESSRLDINLSALSKAVEADIGLHIDKKFNTEPFRSWPKEVKEEARSALIENSDGMFQYVACQFDVLRDHRSKASIQKALRDLPKGLDATYNRILKSIPIGYEKQVAGVLKWLAFSLRPLLLEELAEAFILDPGGSIPFDEDKRLFSPEEVLNYLSGLVVKVPIHIAKYSNDYPSRWDKDVVQIRFVHFSIKEYLCSSRIALEEFSTAEQTSHTHIAESCVTYHLHLSKSILATKDTLERYALWEYAAWKWTFHLERIVQESWAPSVTSQAMQALSTTSQSLLNMVRINAPDRNWTSFKTTPESLPTPLYYTASRGLTQLLSLLIRDGAAVNKISPSALYKTALQTAAYNGHEDIVRLLLAHGVDVNAQGGVYGNALQAAAYREWQGIVRLLLDHSANINAQGGEYGNALQAAATIGEKAIVQLLLDHGADINAQGGEFGNALQAAVLTEEKAIVQLLLDHGADINAQGGVYGNALQAAALTKEKAIVQLLLDHGADINAQGGKYGNALQEAVLTGEKAIVQLLLDHGADINAQGGEYKNALLAAAEKGEKAIVQLLLNHGAEINAKGGYFGNALQAAVAEDELQIAELLLSRGAKVDEPS